ncbi:MAG TPA: acyl-CoA dehydrogenase family protein [Myxococcota bacterium]|nr:acyl-CoA dehydrogenase family protein [Myxococcota bacterium]
MDEHEDLRAELRAWIAAHHPGDPGWKLPQSALEVADDRQFHWLQDWQRKLYDAGYVGAEWPRELGGGGKPRGTQRVIDQELARGRAPFLLNLVALSWAGPVILRYGTESQKKRYIQPLLRCDEIWCQGFSEPGAGSDLASLRTRAERTGSHYRITGHKVWTTLGRYADWCILLARSDDAGAKHAGISYFLAPMKVPGVEVQPLLKLTGEGGFNQVIFDEAEIPADSLLGREGQGWEIAMATLQFERGAAEGSAGGQGGGAEQVASLARLARSLERDGRPALEDPVVRDRLTQFWIEETALRANAARARVPGLVSDRPEALPLMSKLASSEHGQALADFACELLGPGAGLWIGDPHAPANAEWQRSYLNSFAMTIAGGTSEILRNILGERVLGQPKTR